MHLRAARPQRPDRSTRSRRCCCRPRSTAASPTPTPRSGSPSRCSRGRGRRLTTYVAADPDEAVTGIEDGSTVLIGGFGMAGMPVQLIDALIRQGADGPDRRSQQRGQRRHRAGRPARRQAGAQDGLLVPAAVRLVGLRRALPRRRDRARGGAAGQPRRADARGRRGHRRVLLPDRGRHSARGGQGDPGDRRPDLCAGVPDPRRRRADRRARRRPDGQPRLPQDRPQLRAGDGHRRDDRPSRRWARSSRSAGSTRRSWSPRASSSTGWSWCEPRTSLGKDQMAALVARDIPAGSYVNLGIGQPTAGRRPPARPSSGVVLHTENGMLHMGPAAAGDEVDPDLTNAGKQPVTELPGASYFHHADSFAMMRGGHLDVCVLGAFQVVRDRRPGQLAHRRRRRDPRGRRRHGPRDRRQAGLRDDDPVRQGRHARSWCRSARTRSPASAAWTGSTPTSRRSTSGPHGVVVRETLRHLAAPSWPTGWTCALVRG